MQTRKRERLDIIRDMLVSIQERGGEIKPTHLMYKANLAHRQLKSYLEELIEKELVKKITKKNNEYIIITENGEKFIQELKKVKDFQEMFGF